MENEHPEEAPEKQTDDASPKAVKSNVGGFQWEEELNHRL